MSSAVERVGETFDARRRSCSDDRPVVAVATGVVSVPIQRPVPNKATRRMVAATAISVVTLWLLSFPALVSSPPASSPKPLLKPPRNHHRNVPCGRMLLYLQNDLDMTAKRRC